MTNTANAHQAEVHGPYDHVAARDIIINFAFDGSDSPGARRPAVFDPLPLTLLAWGYTVVIQSTITYMICY